MKPTWRSWLAATLIAWASVAQAQVSADLNLDQSRALIFQLLGAGQVQAAKALAETVLSANADDHAALIGLAQADLKLGNGPAAQSAARRAWSAASDPGGRYAAALLVAEALFLQNRRTQAQVWLRLAAQVAPTDTQQKTAYNGLRHIQARKPVRANLSFAVQPSNNINGGARSERVEGGIISGPALALSGVEFTTRANLVWSSRVRNNGLTRATLRARQSTFQLSDEARDIAPDVENSDFTFQEVELDLRRTIQAADGFLTFGTSLGQNWYGGDALSTFQAVHISQSWPISAKQSLDVGLRYEERDREDNSLRSSEVEVFALGWNRAFANGHRTRLQYSRDLTQSQSAIVKKSGWDLRASYEMPVEWAGGVFSLTATYREQEFPIETFFGKRSDRDKRLEATWVWQKGAILGLAPKATLALREVESTVDLYDQQTTSLNLSLTSAF